MGMIEVPRPTVKPKEEIWKRCESLAEKHHLTPLEVLKRFVQIGMEVVEVEELGGEGFVKINGREIEIRVFDKKES